MYFPSGATPEERQLNWPLLGEVNDQTLGFSAPKADSINIRYNVRLVLQNDAGQICLVRSTKNNYVQLPGGGIDGIESITDAAHREAKEETGYEITDLKPLGYTIEHRESVQNAHAWNQSVTFVFVAKAGSQGDTQYTAEEQAEGFVPIWAHPNRAPILINNSTNTNQSYSGAFATWRDSTILAAFQDNG